MPRKTYDLSSSGAMDVAVYENSPGTSLKTITTDLGINRATLCITG